MIFFRPVLKKFPDQLRKPDVLKQKVYGLKPRLQPSSIFLLFVALLGVSNMTNAQITQLEHSATSYAGSVPSGPSTSLVKAVFANNISEKNFVPFSPEINVIASFSDQQYNNAAGISNLKGSLFGVASGDETKAATSQPVWKSLNTLSSPTNEYFTSNPVGTAGEGIDGNLNYGFNMFTTVEPLYTGNKNTSDRYYYSKLTITFSKAVTNPVLHIVGLGETSVLERDVLGYSTELELQSGSDVTLKKLSGSEALKVENNKILNGSKSSINDLSSDGAATGSIRVTGNNIKSLVFKIYLRGDGRGQSWSSRNKFSGDQWLLGFSMNSPTVSGNVFDDGNALNDSKVNMVPSGVVLGTNIGCDLHINLVSGNNIISTADVSDDGTYFFQDIIADRYPAKYSLVLTDYKNSKTPKLPSDWVNTGENIGSSDTDGNDNAIDGMLSINLGSPAASVANANFGINKIPQSDSKHALSRPNPGGKLKVAVPTLTGMDLEDGDYNGIDKANTIKIVSLPGEVKGLLYYDNTLVVLNQVIRNYDPAKLLVNPGDGAPTVSFRYSHKDAAGSYSEPAEVSMPFFISYSVGGNVFDDANGLSGITPDDNKVDGIGVKGSDIDNMVAGNQSLYVSLVVNTSVLATVPVGETGSYLFPENYAAGNYKVVLHTNRDGSVSHSLPLPGYWFNTGENNGAGQGNDGTINGELAFSITSFDLDNLNFGINKVSSAEAKNQTISAPSATVFMTLDGTRIVPALSGFDLEDKALGGAGSKVVITRLPKNGTLYYAEKEITLLNVIISQDFNPSLLQLKIAGKDYTSTDFEYAFVDAAGMQGTSATYQLNWNTPLPVTLTTFTAARQEQSSTLKWSTTSETNSDLFEVQHSIDGKEWRHLGNVAATGESRELKTYSYIHEQPSSGTNLYRLKMIDADGTFAYSRIVSLDFEFRIETAVFPNPATDYIKIKIDGQSDWSKNNMVDIIGMDGRIVLSSRMISDELSIQNLKSGIYILQITGNNGMTSKTRLAVRK
jgi:hypothetical protein